MCISRRTDSSLRRAILVYIIHISRNKWKISKERASRGGEIMREKSISIFFDRILRPGSRLACRIRAGVASAFHVAFNQHSPCHSIGWQKRTREKEREKRRTIVLVARGDRRVSTFSNARRLVRSMARSGPAALFPATGTMASNQWGPVE